MAELKKAQFSVHQIGANLAVPSNLGRDIAIYQGHKRGKSVSVLAREYGLSIQRMRSIVVAMRHRVELSPKTIFRKLRSTEVN